MVIIRNLEKSEFDFLTDMLYESIHIPQNKPNKVDLINSTHIKNIMKVGGEKAIQH